MLGAVGSFAVQLAASHGAHILGVCGNRSLESEKNAGVDAIYSYSDTENFYPIR